MCGVGGQYIILKKASKGEFPTTVESLAPNCQLQNFHHILDVELKEKKFSTIL